MILLGIHLSIPVFFEEIDTCLNLNMRKEELNLASP